MPQATDPTRTLTKEVRVRVGSPDAAELSDVELDRCLAMALDDVNTDRPARGLGSFATVADQSAYDVVPGDAYKIAEVFYDQGVTTANVYQRLGLPDLLASEFANLGFGGGIGAGARIFDNPALLAGWFKKEHSWRRAFRGRWDRSIDDGLVYLSPTPTGECVVFFTYLKPRFADLSRVTKWYEKWVLLRAETYALENLANKRSNVVSGTGVGGGTYRTGGGEVQIRLAQQKRDQYEQQFRALPTGPQIG